MGNVSLERQRIRYAWLHGNFMVAKVQVYDVSNSQRRNRTYITAIVGARLNETLRKFRDRYPKKCNQLCPRCKQPCMQGMTEHFNQEGCLTSHVCGPHWWHRIIGPDCMEIVVSGMVGIRRVSP